MNINTPYASIAEADLSLGAETPWFSASEDEQQRALEMGRAYIDSKYTCVFDETDIPDAVKIANAELANSYIESSSTFVVNLNNIGVKKKKVVAGSVESEKEFDPYVSNPVDPYPHVTLMLTGHCILTATSFQLTR